MPIDESEVELFASAKGFLEIEPLYEATLGEPHREWVHHSKVDRLTWVTDAATGRPALFAHLDVTLPPGIDQMLAQQMVWRKVKVAADGR